MWDIRALQLISTLVLGLGFREQPFHTPVFTCTEKVILKGHRLWPRCLCASSASWHCRLSIATHFEGFAVVQGSVYSPMNPQHPRS